MSTGEKSTNSTLLQRNKSLSLKRVLVIGGGFCGLIAAKHLEKQFSVTLIDPKDYFEYTPSILKYLSGPHERLRIPYKETLSNSRILKGRASYENGKVTLKKNIPFDYLILATGFRPFLPISGTYCYDGASSASIHAAKEQVKKAKSILIIGGGYIGVELAAEIATHYPEKKLTIIHGASRLLERNIPGVSRYAASFFKNRNVSIIYDDLVLSVKGKTYMTREGKKITADIAFICAGTLPNTSAIQHPCLDERKRVKVNKHLQVENEKNIFAGGDITNIQEEKTAQNAEAHGKIIAKNIIRLEKRQELLSYKPSPKAMIISLGDKNGIFTYKRFWIGGLVPGYIKHFVEMRVLRANR
ncbi:MAG: FAD-dependent oxidoreductase [Nanoarchaeota archaeon]